MTTAAMLARRRAGATLAAIATEAGLSRQAVEQRLAQVWPGHTRHAVELRQRRKASTEAKAERARLAALPALPRGPCAVCGRETTRRPYAAWLCSVRCGEEKRTVRWRWANDPAYRAKQSELVRAWRKRHPERSREMHRAWRTSSPERIAAQREYHRAYQERRRKARDAA